VEEREIKKIMGLIPSEGKREREREREYGLTIIIRSVISVLGNKCYGSEGKQKETKYDLKIILRKICEFLS
jgi:hypothetical protein